MDAKLIIVLILLITIYLLYYYKHNTNWIILLSIFNIFIIVEILKDKDNYTNLADITNVPAKNTYTHQKTKPLSNNEYKNHKDEIDEMVMDSILDKDDNDLMYSFIKAAPTPLLPTHLHTHNHPHDQGKPETPKENMFAELYKEEAALEKCINKHCKKEAMVFLKNYKQLIADFKHQHIGFDVTDYNMNSFKTKLEGHIDKLNKQIYNTLNSEIHKDKQYLKEYTECVCSNKNCMVIIHKIKNILTKLMKLEKNKETTKEFLQHHVKYNKFVLFTDEICFKNESTQEYTDIIKILNNQDKELDKLQHNLETVMNNYNNKLRNKYDKLKNNDDIIKINVLKIIEE